MTLTMLLGYGAIAGVVAGTVLSRQRIGCIALLIVPIATILFVGRWQAAHPESIRSTSGLDFLFIPLWASLAALAGFYGARAARAWLARLP